MIRAINILVLILVLAPVVVVMWMSLTPTAMFVLPVTQISLRWYREALSYPGFVDAFVLSAKLATLAAAVTIALCFSAVYGIVRYRPRGAAALRGFFTAPLLVSAVVFGIAMLQFVNRIGLYNSFWALVATHIVVVTPFAIRTLEATLRGIGPELEWAAMSLGARPSRALIRVTVPLALRGIVAAFLLAFLMSFSEVTVTIFMTGPAQQTLPVRIFNYVSDRIDPTVAAVSALIIALTLALVFVLNLVGGLRQVAK